MKSHSVWNKKKSDVRSTPTLNNRAAPTSKWAVGIKQILPWTQQSAKILRRNPNVLFISARRAHRHLETQTGSSHHVVRFIIPSLRITRTLRGASSLTSARREHEQRVPVLVSSAAVRPPRLRLNKFVGSDVSPPRVILETMRLLVLATLFGVLLDAGRCNLERLAAAF